MGFERLERLHFYSGWQSICLDVLGAWVFGLLAFMGKTGGEGYSNRLDRKIEPDCIVCTLRTY